ncbi:MAG TPA: class I SAM-dependent methyltransferase [Pirellulales bacterium]|nr:class I SAM-dependent methyltransferase [Pirellulales bacterium]
MRRPVLKWLLFAAVGQVTVAAAFAQGQVASDQSPAAASSTDRAVSTTSDPLPEPLQFYKGREIAPYMTFHGADWLVRKERQSEEDCNRLVKALKIKPGQTVCDMGCGNGFYTIRMARLVGERGRVLAVDIQPEMLSLLDKQVKGKKIKHVEPILSTPIDPSLPEGEVDLILIVDVYHEFTYPEHMLKAMRKSLAPGGRIALAEFRLEDPSVPIKLLHKMSKEQILKEYEPNGFKLVEQFDELPWQHLMFFEKDDSK